MFRFLDCLIEICNTIVEGLREDFPDKEKNT
jgi:hypothetical protein